MIFRRICALSLLGVAALLTSCGDSGVEGPIRGTISVSVTTSGEDLDPDGYTVTVGSVTRPLGVQGSQLRFEDLVPGTHIVVLGGLAVNCTEEGEGRRQVVVQPGGVVNVAFRATCGVPVGTLRVEVTTEGYREEEGYSVTLEQTGDVIDILNQETLVWPELEPGDYTVRVADPAPNCSMGDRERVATVTAGGDVTLRYEVMCADPPGFQIDVDLRTDGVSTQQEQAIRDGVARWEAVITSDLEARIDMESEAGEACSGIVDPDVDVDDVRVYIVVEDIDGDGDGDGDTWARAGPCHRRGSAGAPLLGKVTIDRFNLPEMSMDDLRELTTHEVGHILGFSQGLIDGVNPTLVVSPAGQPRRFTGENARAQWEAAGGSNVAAGVPMESTTHWHEGQMQHELMTPFLEKGEFEPLSPVTLGFLEDLFYEVDYSAADAFDARNPAGVSGREGPVVRDEVDEGMLGVEGPRPAPRVTIVRSRRGGSGPGR